MLKYCDIHLFEICCIIVNSPLCISTSLQIMGTCNLCMYLIIIIINNVLLLLLLSLLLLLLLLFNKYYILFIPLFI